jgi:hypothetical protein
MCFLICFAAPASANAEKIKRVDVDDKKNVHIVTAHNHHAQITHTRNATAIRLALDE